jgi:hypothetical protein
VAPIAPDCPVKTNDPTVAFFVTNGVTAVSTIGIKSDSDGVSFDGNSDIFLSAMNHR